MRWSNGRGSGGPSAGGLAVAIIALLGLGLAVAPVQAASAASLAGAVAAVQTAPAAKPTPAELVPPLLTPGDGAYLEGDATVAATPVVVDEDVTALTVDGADVPSAPTLGISILGYDVATNSTEARYRNYVLINGSDRSTCPTP